MSASPVRINFNTFVHGSPRKISAALANAEAKRQRKKTMKLRKNTNFAELHNPDPRGNKKSFFRERGYAVEPHSEIESFRRKKLKAIIKRRQSASKSVSKSASRKSPQSRPSLGDKFVYYTENGVGRSIQLKYISLDSELVEMLRAEEMAWLIAHTMKK